MKSSHSSMQDYKRCRRMYWFKNVEKIFPNEPVVDARERGLSYHAKVEQIMNTGDFERDRNAKTNAMAKVFKTFAYPQLAPVRVEDWFSYQTPSGHTVIGRLDGVDKDGSVIEHKTTSGEVDEVYINALAIDEQIPTYMIACNTDHCLYTVCSTPTIRQKKNETDDEFEERCYDWLTSGLSAFVCMDVYRTPEQLKAFLSEQDRLLTEMENCDLWYRNTSHCTKWGRMCEYAPICESYNPNEEYINFTKKE